MIFPKEAKSSDFTLGVKTINVKSLRGILNEWRWRTGTTP